MTITLFMQALMVFGVMVALDFVWAEYTKAITADRRHAASSLSALLILFSGVVAINYVGDHRMLVPAMAGAYLGTYLSLRFGRK